MSPSKNPQLGLDLVPGQAARAILERSTGEGVMVEVPRSWSVALAGARYRWIVARAHRQQLGPHAAAVPVLRV